MSRTAIRDILAAIFEKTYPGRAQTVRELPALNVRIA